MSIIAKFGGIRAMASKLGHRNHTTVQGWAARGIIPAPRQTEVLDAANLHGIPVTAADLIEASRPTEQASDAVEAPAGAENEAEAA